MLTYFPACEGGAGRDSVADGVVRRPAEPSNAAMGLRCN